jgi:hypothetical protein
MGGVLTVVSEGQAHFLTSPLPPVSFELKLPVDEPRTAYDDDEATRTLEDSENRLLGMLAAQAAHRDDHASVAADDEDNIALDGRMSTEEKRDTLQKALNMAASNGDVERIDRLLGGKARVFVDVNAPDEDGTAPLIYASCFVGAFPLNRGGSTALPPQCLHLDRAPLRVARPGWLMVGTAGPS